MCSRPHCGTADSGADAAVSGAPVGERPENRAGCPQWTGCERRESRRSTPTGMWSGYCESATPTPTLSALVGIEATPKMHHET